MRILILLLLLIFLSPSSHAQFYTPIDTLNPNSGEVLRYLNSRTKELEKEFKTYPVTDKKIIKSFVQSRKHMFEELIKDNNLIYDIELEKYINGIIHKLANENEIDSKPLRIFLSRDTDPNAYSLGDGNFVFNLSLLNRLENEEELYFILAHELAHYRLDHLKNQMTAKMQLSMSKEYISKQKQIRKSKYNKFSKSLEEYRVLLYDNSATSRKRELAADSLAFIFVQKIIKNPYNTISALEKLDSIFPSEIYKIDVDILKSHFSSTNMPFQEAWTEGYDFSKYNYQRGRTDIFGIHKDSLMSHPERVERILNLKKLISVEDIIISKEVDSFQKLKQKIAFEDVYAHYCLEEYGRGIYLVLQLQNSKEITSEEDQFYSFMLSLFYRKLAKSRTSFTFKKYVDDVNFINFSQEYILFLTILDNLRSSELQELATKYNV